MVWLTNIFIYIFKLFYIKIKLIIIISPILKTKEFFPSKLVLNILHNIHIHKITKHYLYI